jgi:hypothetical protein
MRPRRGHAEALCEHYSALHGARTRLKKRLVAQLLHVRQPPLAQKPHVLRVLRPDRVHSLAAVLPGRDHPASHAMPATAFIFLSHLSPNLSFHRSFTVFHRDVVFAEIQQKMPVFAAKIAST